MKFANLDGNELTASLEAGETLYFDLHYLRSPKFSRDMTPHFWEAMVPRLLAGKLWEPHLTAGHEGDIVLLSGPEPYGRFHVVVVEPGRKMFVRLKHLVGYAFNDGGRFSSSFNLLDPVRWLIGAPTSVFLHGPASLIFYGRAVEDVMADAGEECFADQIHAFSAEAPFQVCGYLPQGTGFWADLINTISTTVNMTFLAPVRLIKTTIRREHTNRLGRLWRLVFVSILIGWLIQRLVFSGVNGPPTQAQGPEWGSPLDPPPDDPRAASTEKAMEVRLL